MSEPLNEPGNPASEAAPLTVSEASGQQPPEAMFGPITSQQSYTARFAVAYVGLGVLLAAALVGLIVLVIRPGHKAGPVWSNWQPASAAATTGTKEIADHVQHEYRLSATGPDLVAVVPSSATVTSQTTNIAVKAIAVEKVAQSTNGMSVIYDPKTEFYQLCGLGQNCSIAAGQATTTRGRLVRREALELALYTFKFVPDIDSVAAFMPPPPGQQAQQVLFFQKSDMKDQLDQPLSETLSSSPAPLPTDPDTSEKATIDRLTLPHYYSYQLQPLETGGAALILAPGS